MPLQVQEKGGSFLIAVFRSLPMKERMFWTFLFFQVDEQQEESAAKLLDSGT